MILECGRPAGSGLVFCESFRTRQLIQSRGGAIVGCTVGNGISPTAVSSRVTFAGTENIGINATQMTIVLRFRLSASNNAAQTVLLSKSVSALTNNQSRVVVEANRVLRVYVAASAADVANYISADVALVVGTDYHLAVPCNGSLIAASRAVLYLQGAVVASTITGTIPASMRASTAAITAYNPDGGSTLAPAVDTLLRSARIYNTAWSAEEVLDDYQNDTFSELFGGG